ncbi:MAG: FeoB-associated Cys-rich membrane protein [Eubacterium sp.]|nr:FeoB-associated Cys-rich membrane protein [Eubacterium sp.]
MNEIVGTILVLIVLLAVVALIICSMIRDKKAGKSVICGGSCKSCGGCCSSCSGCPRSKMNVRERLN